MDIYRKQEIVDLLTKPHIEFVQEMSESYTEEQQDLKSAIESLEKAIAQNEKKFMIDIVENLESEFSLKFPSEDKEDIGNFILTASLSRTYD